MSSTISLLMAIAKSAADINLSMHFNSRGPLPKYETRRSLLDVVRMPIIFSPRPCGVSNFMEVFSRQTCSSANSWAFQRITTLSLLTPLDGED
jgi:hypothetical protein